MCGQHSSCSVIAGWQDGKTSSAAQLTFGVWDDASFEEMEAYLVNNNIEIISASDEALQHHVVADGLLSKDRCSELLPLDVVCFFATWNRRSLRLCLQCNLFITQPW